MNHPWAILLLCVAAIASSVVEGKADFQFAHTYVSIGTEQYLTSGSPIEGSTRWVEQTFGPLDCKLDALQLSGVKAEMKGDLSDLHDVAMFFTVTSQPGKSTWRKEVDLDLEDEGEYVSGSLYYNLLSYAREGDGTYYVEVWFTASGIGSDVEDDNEGNHYVAEFSVTNCEESDASGSGYAQSGDGVELPIVYRDIVSRDIDGELTRHPDFQMPSTGFRANCFGDLPSGCEVDCMEAACELDAIYGLAKNMVEDLLDEDGRPVYRNNRADTPVRSTSGSIEANAYGRKSIHDADSFSSWFNSTSELTREVNSFITLEVDPTGEYRYAYTNWQFFPLSNIGTPDTWNDKEDFDDVGTAQNFGFTSELKAAFVYTGSGAIEVCGDDDIWVFIAGQLVIDLGGIHSALCRTIDLSTFPVVPTGGRLGGEFLQTKGDGLTIIDDQSSSSNLENMIVSSVSPYTDGDREWNGLHEASVITTTEFILEADSPITFTLRGGKGVATQPGASIDSIDGDASKDGFLGVALRDVESGAYLAWVSKSANNDDEEELKFSENELIAFEGTRVVVDIIDDFVGDYGWIQVTDMKIPELFDESPITEIEEETVDDSFVLENGQTYEFSIFHAERHSPGSHYRLRTSIILGVAVDESSNSGSGSDPEEEGAETDPPAADTDAAGADAGDDLTEEEGAENSDDLVCPGEWSEWSQCSATCGSGTKTRNFVVTVAGDFPGKDECNAMTEEMDCDLPPCYHAAVCGSCDDSSSHSCYSAMVTACESPDKDMFEDFCDTCYVDPVETCSDDVDTWRLSNCGIDGGWSDWSEWTPCNTDNNRTRTRTCTNPTPSFDGEDCEGDAEEEETCAHVADLTEDLCATCGTETDTEDCRAQMLRSCEDTSTFDFCDSCLVNPTTSCFTDLQDYTNTNCLSINGGWSAWSEWGECDEDENQERTRDCLITTREGCVSGDSSETRSCTAGHWTEFGDWTVCNEDNFRMRIRTCECERPGCGTPTCNGLSVEHQACIDGGFSEWSEWSQNCDDSTSSIRTRTCTNPEPKNGGKDCTELGDFEEERACVLDGQWGAWSAWTDCDDPDEPRERTRQCDSPSPLNGGKDCVGDSKQQLPCIVDGEWSDWSEWTGCGANDQKYRVRFCNDPEPANGGRDCDGESQQQMMCRDGGWTKWTNWSACINGRRFRERSCTAPSPLNGGEDCQGDGLQEQVCVDGGWSEWQDYGNCSDDGLKTAYRTCTNPAPQNGGAGCGPKNSKTASCINGGWTTWTTYGECNATAVRNRTRSCTNPEPADGGRDCDGDATQFQDCTVGGWSNWSAWGACDERAQERTRTRKCNNPTPAKGGKNCEGDSSQSQTCMAGGWSEWSEWSDCLNNENFEHTRTRTCSNPIPFNGGSDCTGVTTETEICAPVLMDDDFQISEDNPPKTFSILDNDYSLNDMTLTELGSPTQGGSVVMTTGQRVQYTPPADYFGDETFEYKVQDDDGRESVGTVTIHIDGVNDAPSAVDDSLTVEEDCIQSKLDVLDNDEDVDGDPLVIYSVGSTSKGGTVEVDGGKYILYTAKPDFTGTDTFTYTVHDSRGSSDVGTVVVYVSPTNDAPVAVEDEFETEEDADALSLDVLRNDIDVDSTSLRILSTKDALIMGTVTISSDGQSLTYTPASNKDICESFSYEVSDGELSSEAKVTVCTASVNDAPEAQDDAFEVLEDTPFETSYAVLANDEDVDISSTSGDKLKIIRVSASENGGTTGHSDTLVTYIPPADFSGEDTFTYTMTDLEGETAEATVTVTVTNVNDNPTAEDDTADCDEDVADCEIYVLANDSDADGDDVTLKQVSFSTMGGRTIISTDDDGVQRVLYTPKKHFSGTDVFSYTIDDGTGSEAQGVVTVTVANTNDDPDTTNDYFTVISNTNKPATYNVLVNDEDDDEDELVIGQVYSPSEGGVCTISADKQSLIYRPATDFIGQEKVIYVASDGQGGTEKATVYFSVVESPTNDAVANPDTFKVDEDSSNNELAVLDNDSDLFPQDLELTFVSDASHGKTKLGRDRTKVLYTPEADFVGQDTFTYSVKNTLDQVVNGTVTVNVVNVNDAPTLADDDFQVDEDSLYNVFEVLENDDDIDDDPLYISEVGDANHGTVRNNGFSITYVPEINYNGQDQFTYTITDPDGETAEGYVNVNVRPVNDKPVAYDDTFTVAEDSDWSDKLDLADNDFDLENDRLYVTETATPPNGKVKVIAGKIQYLPDEHFFGVDRFQYTVTDGQDTATGYVSIVVVPGTHAPSPSDDLITIDEEETVQISVLENDFDLDHDPLKINAVASPANGKAKIVEDDTMIEYTPNEDWYGIEKFNYTVEDPEGKLTQATITVTVRNVNDLPSAVEDSFAVDEDSGKSTFNLVNNDVDKDPKDQDKLKITSVSRCENGGRVVISSDKEVDFTPKRDFFGTDSFTYTIDDGHDAISMARVTVTVAPVDDAPFAIDDSADCEEDGNVDIKVLDNDEDTEDDFMSICDADRQSENDGTIKTIVDPRGGFLNYKPAPNFCGEDTFTYKVCANSLSGTGTVTVRVACENDHPTANDDKFELLEDSRGTMFSLTANDVDEDGDDLTVTSVTMTSQGGTVVRMVNGNIMYTPLPDFNGIDTFGYTLSDGTSGSTDEAEVSIHVKPVNDDPVAQNDEYTVAEDASPGRFDVLGNDKDKDNDHMDLTVSDLDLKHCHGRVTISDDQLAIMYSPAPNYNGIDLVQYTVTDGSGGYANGLARFRVEAMNDEPAANDDAFSIEEDCTKERLEVLDNDSDADDGTLQILSYEDPPSGATIEINRDGEKDVLLYTAAKDFVGVDKFSYKVHDGLGGEAEAQVTVSVTNVNDHPVANEDAFTVFEDSGKVAWSVLSNDVDVDKNKLIIIDVSETSEGSKVRVNRDSVRIDYKPKKNFCGNETLTYTISDSQGGVAVGLVNVTVVCQNDSPTAKPDSYKVVEDSETVTLEPLTNDFDIDGDALYICDLDVADVDGEVHLVDNKKEILFTPAPEVAGEFVIHYTICDPEGKESYSTINIEVIEVNDAPLANEDEFFVDEDSGESIFDVLENDSDQEEGALHLSEVGDCDNGGTVVLHSDGKQVVYTPAEDFSGTETFTYTVSDGEGEAEGTVSVVVAGVNDIPKGVDDEFTVDEDCGRVTLDVLANDDDPDTEDTLTIMAVITPTEGRVKVSADSRRIEYSPAEDFHGQESFTYIFEDGNDGRSSATVTVTVNPVNDAPSPVDDKFEVVEDAALSGFFVLENDIDVDGDAVYISAVTDPDQGGSAHISPDKKEIRYMPKVDFFGTEKLTYAVSDPFGASQIATVEFEVLAMNDKPFANDDEYTFDEDSGPQELFVTENDSDKEAESLFVAAVGTPDKGGSVSIDALNGKTSLHYTSAENFFGTETFTYTVSDLDGGTDDATVTITVVNVPDLPVAIEDSITVKEDSDENPIYVLRNDQEFDREGLTVTKVFEPSHGGTVVIDGDKVLYTPADDFNEVEEFEYTIQDTSGEIAISKVVVTVNNVEDAPRAEPDKVTTCEDCPEMEINPFENDFEPDGEEMIVSKLSQPSKGGAVRISDDGKIIYYTPATDFVGKDTFKYTVEDPQGNKDKAMITVTVTPVNDEPIANSDEYELDEDSPHTALDVMLNDVDPDEDSLLLQSVESNTEGAIVRIVDGLVDYTPPTNFNGEDTFTYIIHDGAGGNAETTVYIKVNPVNDMPEAVDDTYEVEEGSDWTILPVIENDVDVDGDTLLVSLVSEVRILEETSNRQASSRGSVNPAGIVEFEGDGEALKFKPDTDFAGSVEFSYTVTDPDGLETNANVVVRVNPVNDAPIATGDSYEVGEDTALSWYTVLDNDYDLDGDTLSIHEVGTPTEGGTAVINTNGVQLDYAPAKNFVGEETVTYTVTDGELFSEAVVTFTVVNINDRPIANDDMYEVDEDTSDHMFRVLDDDSDVDMDSLTISAVGTPNNKGSAVISTDGSAPVILYSPAEDFNGVETFSYTVADSEGGEATAYVTVTVNPVNDEPVAEHDSYTMQEDGNQMELTPLINDLDIDGDDLTICEIELPDNGGVASMCPDQTCILYTPAANYAGVETFGITICDPNGGSSSSTITMTVRAVNDAPEAEDDIFTIAEDSDAAEFEVTANDMDVDEGDSIKLTGVTPSYGVVGTFRVSSDDAIEYKPKPDFVGTESCTYTIQDSSGLEAKGTMVVEVLDVNDEPIANDDHMEVDEDSGWNKLYVLLDDTDPEGNTLALQEGGLSTPEHGDAKISEDYKYIMYKPDDDFFGDDSFTYTIHDGAGGTAQATVYVTVDNVEDAPIAKEDTFEVYEGDSETLLQVLANDSDADDDVLTLVSVMVPSAMATVGIYGDAIKYEPSPHYSGAETFKYKVQDASGKEAIGEVRVKVIGINDAPNVENDHYEMAEDSEMTFFDLTDNDSDLDNDELTIVDAEPLDEDNWFGTYKIAVDPEDGRTKIQYMPGLDWHGEEVLKYTVSDGTEEVTGQVTFTVSAVNDHPFANPDVIKMVQHENERVVDVLENDSDAEMESIVVVSFTQPAHGNVTMHDDKRTFTYRCADTFAGMDPWTYTIIDSAGGEATGDVLVEVEDINDGPTAHPDSFETLEDNSVECDVLENDTDLDVDDVLTVGFVTQPKHGGKVEIIDDGAKLKFTPKEHWSGNATFKYTVLDTAGGAAQGKVVIEVLPENDAPTANKDTFNVPIDAHNYLLTVLANDEDVEDVHGGVNNLVVSKVSTPESGFAVADANGIRFWPDPRDSEVGDVIKMTYTLEDTEGLTATSTVTVILRKAAGFSIDGLVEPEFAIKLDGTADQVPFKIPPVVVPTADNPDPADPHHIQHERPHLKNPAKPLFSTDPEAHRHVLPVTPELKNWLGPPPSKEYNLPEWADANPRAHLYPSAGNLPDAVQAPEYVNPGEPLRHLEHTHHTHYTATTDDAMRYRDQETLSEKEQATEETATSEAFPGVDATVVEELPEASMMQRKASGTHTSGTSSRKTNSRKHKMAKIRDSSVAVDRNSAESSFLEEKVNVAAASKQARFEQLRDLHMKKMSSSSKKNKKNASKSLDLDSLRAKYRSRHSNLMP